MPARTFDRSSPTADTATDIAPPAQSADATTFSSDGDLPAVSQADTAPPETASERAYDQAQLASVDQGMHEPEEFQAACQAAGKTDRWDPRYEQGHTSAQQWMQPYDGREMMQFLLKAGHSASRALHDFMNGPTIADYRTISVAQDLNELRDELGDAKFDSLFGSNDAHEDALIPDEQRLQISSDMYTIPFYEQMKELARAGDAQDTQVVTAASPPVDEQVEDKPKQPVVEDIRPIVMTEDLGRQPERELA